MNNFIEFYDEEIWEPLIAFDIKQDMYEISNLGNIRNINGYILSPSIINSGYMSINLRTNDGGSKHFLVHRLVASSFILCKRIEANQVNHLDSERIHNEDYNLEWCTGKENTRYAMENGHFNLGEMNYLAKLTDEQAHQICRLLEEGKIYKDILDIIGLDSSPYSNNYDLICNIKRGVAWKHISSQYNLSDISFNGSNYTDDQIYYMCKLLEEGRTYPEIYEDMFKEKYINSRKHRDYYEFIRRLKTGKTFTHISSQFNL